MWVSLDQLPPGYRDQAWDKLGKQGINATRPPSRKQDPKQRRRERLIESMRQCRGCAGWVMAGNEISALALCLPGALLASINDLLHTLNLRSRIAYRTATHEAVWRAIVDLPPKPAEFVSPFGITVYRVAPVMRQDLDAINAKYLIDGVVKAGLIPDDNPTHVGEISLKRGEGDWAAAMLVYAMHAPVTDPELTLRAAFPERIEQISSKRRW